MQNKPEPQKFTRAVVGRLMKAAGWSKHGRIGLNRRRKQRPGRRVMLSRTFSRTTLTRLLKVT